MNHAAVDWAETFTHPRVTEAAHEVLTAIARLIPEGETTTPLIGMRTIARLAHVDRRTVWTWLPVLVEIGAVCVVDGGQGRRARYTLVHIDGIAPPVAAVLPLRADLQAVRPRPLAATPLFDDPPIRRSESEELVIPITSRAARTITRITSWLVATITSYTSWPLVRSKSEELVIRTCDPTCDPALPRDADDARARDVLLLKETTTTTAPPSQPPRPRAVESPPCGSPPCRYFGTRHAWCGSRAHVPRDFHREERRRSARQPGETDADLDARLFRRYAKILGGIPETEDLGRYKDDFEICKAYLRAASPEATPKSREPTRDPRRRPDIPSTRPCPHDPQCADTPACVDRTMAEWQAEKAGSG